MVFFIIFRNIFFNFVIKKSKSNRMNISMTGWIFAYYLSYVLNFLPICGIMNIIVSTYYTAYINYLKPTFLTTNPFINTFSSPMTGINLFFQGNVPWFVPIIIWIAGTFTQKYHLFKFNWKMLIYNLLGIFLFYEGLVSALSIEVLVNYAPF